MNTFIDAYKDIWRRYAQFDGRTSVGGFWRVVLVNFLVGVVAGFVLGIFIVSDLNFVAIPVIVAMSLYGLAIIIPGLALGVRRLHDTDKSGWMLLVGLIPVIGQIVLIVFYVSGGTPASNRYGPPPMGTQWTTDGFMPGGAYMSQVPGVAGAPGAPGAPPPPPPAN